LNSVNNHVHRAELAGRHERLASPQMVQILSAKRYSDGVVYNAYVVEDAPESDTVHCFFRYDGTLPKPWSKKVWLKDDVVISSDAKSYRCHTGYDATNDTEELTKPITDANYASHWEVIEEIEVLCEIYGGGNLLDADPLLLTTHSTIGFAADYPAGAVTIIDWAAGTISAGVYVWGTNSREIFKARVTHTATVDNRPTSGDDWNKPTDVKWDCVCRFAAKLKVVKIDGAWEALETFEAKIDDSPNVPVGT
jgi:hypothetical protein